MDGDTEKEAVFKTDLKQHKGQMQFNASVINEVQHHVYRQKVVKGREDLLEECYCHRQQAVYTSIIWAKWL